MALLLYFIKLRWDRCGWLYAYVSFRDIDTGKVPSDQSRFEEGFTVNNTGERFTVSVSKDNGEYKNVKHNDTFTEAGKYVFTISSEMNDKYTRTVTVNKGIKTKSLLPLVYENGPKGTYSDEGSYVNGMTSFGKRSLSSLKIGQHSDVDIARSSKNGVKAFGVKGDAVGIYMNVQSPGSNYSFMEDEWGQKEKQLVMDTHLGVVRTGVLLIQKSNDGGKWRGVGEDCYADGLNLSDFGKNYADNGDMLIYRPDGKEIQHGIYLRITFAYNIMNNSSEKGNRCVEIYKFYLCSDELGAVTFHNLTLDDKDFSKFTSGDDIEYEAETILNNAETLVSGSSTVTGFEVDDSMNPTVTLNVKKDGRDVVIPEDKKITGTGKYDITLTSAVGSKKTLTIYVDRRSDKDVINEYFNGFITGKRIYSEGKYPTFEGGEFENFATKYCLKKQDQRFRSVKGTIKNITTGTEIVLSQNNVEQSEVLTEPGTYLAEFTTRPDDEDCPGDYRKISFHFIILEHGTAPGPVKNKETLCEYAKTNVSDYYPMYYGVTEKVNNVDITVAFASFEDAENFAVELESQKAEKLNDGTYKYEDEKKDVQKIVYSDNKSLTEAINSFAKQRVQNIFFDLTKEMTYQTLNDIEIESADDLRKKKFKRSVIIAGEGQRIKLGEKGVYSYPLISSKPYQYMNESKDDFTVGANDFQFVKDKNGYDSKSFEITDANGKTFTPGYNTNIGEFLQKNGCKTGIVHITEKTCYGDANTYDAIFIAEGENTAQLSINYSNDGKEETVTANQSNFGNINIDTDYFTVADLIDEFDPYGIVRITNLSDKKFNAGKPIYYVEDVLHNGVGDTFATKGQYEVSVINRLGYSYSVNINVSGNKEIKISIQDQDNIVSTAYGAKNVNLPDLQKNGYELIGYYDENGKEYSKKIDEIKFKGDTILIPIWKAKQYNITLLNPDETKYSVETVEFETPFELPVPEVEEGMEFVCWLSNDEPVDGNIITLEQEGDITLTASVRPISKMSIEPQKEKTDNKKRSKPIFVVVSVLVLTGAAVKKYKGGKHNEKN